MPAPPNPTLTLAELKKSTIEEDVAKEAYAQAEKLLTDMLETKKAFDQRAATLLTGFTTLALALTGAGGAFLAGQPLAAHAPTYLPYAFFAASVPLIIAAWTMVRVLQARPYGNLGSAPDVWLQAGVIDTPKAVGPRLARVTFYMRERIRVSNESNNARGSLIRLGSWFALSSPVILIIGTCIALALGK